MPDEMEGMVYNTEVLTLLTKDGVGSVDVAKNILLSNEFQLATIAPGQLAADQDTAMFILTFKGIDPQKGTMGSFTIVAPPEMAPHLIKMLRLKFVEIPIEHR